MFSRQAVQHGVNKGHLNQARMAKYATASRSMKLCPCLQVQGSSRVRNLRHRASCILGQAFRYSPANAFYIFNQQIYFII